MGYLNPGTCSKCAYFRQDQICSWTFETGLNFKDYLVSQQSFHACYFDDADDYLTVISVSALANTCKVLF